MRHYLQDKQLVNLYSSFIKPYIEYGSLDWGGACKTNLNKIDKSLNKSVRTMLFKNRRESSEPLYKYHNILLLDFNIKLLHGKFMQKLLSKQQPKVIEDIYPLHFNESINNPDHTKLISPSYRTSIGTSSLHYQGCKVWNEVPKHLKKLQHTKLFSKKFFESLLEEMTNGCTRT